MPKPSADDVELRRACAAAIASTGAKEEVVFSIRVAKGRGIFEKLGRLAKPRVLALTCTLSLSFNSTSLTTSFQLTPLYLCYELGFRLSVLVNLMIQLYDESGNWVISYFK